MAESSNRHWWIYFRGRSLRWRTKISYKDSDWCCTLVGSKLLVLRLWGRLAPDEPKAKRLPERRQQQQRALKTV